LTNHVTGSAARLSAFAPSPNPKRYVDMNRHINLRAAWLAPLALVALGACGSGESRSMEQVFADMEDVAAEAQAAMTSDDGTIGLGDLDDDMLTTMGDLTGRIGDLYGELADVAPAEYRDEFGECAELAHKGAEALKKGWAAVMSLAEEVDGEIEGDPEAACEKAMEELGGPNLSSAV
jgi:hypothetical protein